MTDDGMRTALAYVRAFRAGDEELMGNITYASNLDGFLKALVSLVPLDAEYLVVACPTCKAACGQPCNYRGGSHRTTHLARQDRAVRAEQRHAKGD